MTKRARKAYVAVALSVALILALVGVFVLPELLAEKKVFDTKESVEGLTDVLGRELPADVPKVVFVDVTEASGVAFTHAPGKRSSVLPEDMGSGVALADYDGDGDLDLYLVNAPATFGRAEPGEGRNRLYRNLGGFRFEDVTDRAGVGDPGFGMGAAFGDYDGDGDLDLYVTNVGPNKLFENRGDGTFEDVTKRAGVGCERFGAGAVFADLDGDLDLDLYVVNYVDWDPSLADDADRSSQYGQGVPATLNPSVFKGAANRLYRNNGDGTFTDVARELRVDDAESRGMGVTVCDFDLDGIPEIYIANDITTNKMYKRRPDGTYADVSGPTLTADYKGAMGLAVADYDADGDQDMFITHWLAQEDTLYQNAFADLGRDKKEQVLIFDDVSSRVGLGASTLAPVGWGTHFIDYDNDGLADLFLVNGSTLEDASGNLKAEENILFWNAGERGFFAVGECAGKELVAKNVGRGLAVGDIDKDGDLDMVVTRNRGPVALFRNDGGNANNRLRVRLADVGPNRLAIGATVTVVAGERRTAAVVGASTSYLSQNELDLHFGLGNRTKVDAVEVHWPNGEKTVVRDIAAPKSIVIHRGREGYEEVSP